MWRGVTIKTPAAALPLTGADLAARLRVDDPAEHALLETYLREALSDIDGPSGVGVAVMRQTWTLTRDRFDLLIELPGWPIAGASEIRFLDAADTWQTVDPGSYRLVTGCDPVLVMPKRGDFWPWCPIQPGAVQIDYLVGAATPAEADPGLVAAAALIAGHRYEHRAAVEAGDLREIPLGASHILSRYRRGLAGA